MKKLKSVMPVLFIIMLFIPDIEAAGAFTTPVWDSTALWSKTPERDAGSGARGFWLDGPILETMMGGDVGLTARFFTAPEDGPYGFFMRDTGLNDRIHLITGSSVRGYLDGPFDRARFASWHYLAHRFMANSGQYIYFTEPENKTAQGYEVIRRLDLIRQEVTTIPNPTPYISDMFSDSAGNLYLKNMYGTDLTILYVDGSTRVIQLAETGEQIKQMALDEKRNRIYAGTFMTKKWYVLYWDLADGAFHGLIPYDTTNMRGRNVPGPFEGANLYHEIYLGFGPDDPEKRYLYLYPNDTHLMLRADLVDRYIWTSSVESDGLRFISTGTPNNVSGWTLRWSENGDFGAPDVFSCRHFAYKRIR